MKDDNVLPAKLYPELADGRSAVSAIHLGDYENIAGSLLWATGGVKKWQQSAEGLFRHKECSFDDRLMAFMALVIPSRVTAPTRYGWLSVN